MRHCRSRLKEFGLNLRNRRSGLDGLFWDIFGQDWRTFVLFWGIVCQDWRNFGWFWGKTPTNPGPNSQVYLKHNIAVPRPVEAGVVVLHGSDNSVGEFCWGGTWASWIILGIATAEKDIQPPTLRAPQEIASDESTERARLILVQAHEYVKSSVDNGMKKLKTNCKCHYMWISIGFLTWGAAEYFPFVFELILSRSLFFFSSKFQPFISFLWYDWKSGHMLPTGQRCAPPIVTMWSQSCQKFYKVASNFSQSNPKLFKSRLQVALM